MQLIPRRLSVKLILSLTLIVALVEGIFGYINARTQERQLQDLMNLGADQLSKAITSSTWHAMLADQRDAAYEMMQTIAEKQGINRIRIFNKEGRVMFSTGSDANTLVDKTAESCSMCHSALQPLVKVDVPSRARLFSGADGRRQLGIVTPIYNEPACSEAPCHAHPVEMKVLGVLDVVLDFNRVDEEVAAMWGQTLLAMGIHVLLVGIFIAFFTRHFVDTPIRKLIAGTRSVSAMELDKPIVIKTSEELGELAESFNAMRGQLKIAMEEVNQFTQSLETKVEERTAQLKAAHQKLLHTDRLASLGQLSASVAHEINNPISGVLNLSMLMQRLLKEDGVPADRLAEFRKYLGQVVNETARVGRIVSDLLAFSRQAKPQSKRADMNAIIRATVSLVSHKLKLGNVEVQLGLADDLPVVHGDASQMQQVILNLVMNGAEASIGKPERRVAIATHWEKSTDSVVVDVTDNGEGILPEILPKIFDPFFTTKGEGKGVGLGLAVVYGIVDAHNGEITVKSSPGAGSIFTVTIPVTGTERDGGGGMTPAGERGQNIGVNDGTGRTA